MRSITRPGMLHTIRQSLDIDTVSRDYDIGVCNGIASQDGIITDWCFRYSDDNFEYRHVQLPKQMLKAIPKEYFDGTRGTLKLLWEEEWRALGITQSLGWEHYEVHEPEPHILLFKYVN